MTGPFNDEHAEAQLLEHIWVIDPVTHEVRKAKSFEEWSAQCYDPSQRIVGRRVVGSALVSTVFLGIVHPGGMLFETMVFDDGSSDELVKRYKTWDEAVAGHQAVVDSLISQM